MIRMIDTLRDVEVTKGGTEMSFDALFDTFFAFTRSMGLEDEMLLQLMLSYCFDRIPNDLQDEYIEIAMKGLDGEGIEFNDINEEDNFELN